MSLTLAALLLATTGAGEGCGESAAHPSAASSQVATSTASTTSSDATADTAGAPDTGSASGSKGAGRRSPASGAGKASGAGVSAHAKPRLALPSSDSQPAPRLSSAERANLPAADIVLRSAVVQRRVGGAQLPATYTCHGADSSLPLSWGSVPAGTREMTLFAMNSQPVAGKLFFDWALAGIDPALHGLKAGQMPAGAVEGRNGYGKNGYSICPPAGGHETYVVVLYALPNRLSTKPGFDPAALKAEAMRSSRHTGLLAVTNG